MHRIIKGAIIAATALTAIGATAGSANAATTESSDPACVPVTEKAAVAEVKHTEYKYKPVVNGTGPTHWATEDAPANSPLVVNGVKYVRDGVKTQTVIDVAAAPPVTAVICPTTVTFTNSQGLPLEGGEAWAVAPNGTWIRLGTTGPTGPVSAELAPGSYEFTMDYLGARQSQTVLVGDGGAQVAFKTASATVTFTNSKGLPLEGGEAWAVAPNGTWIRLGTTGPTGPVSAELAPGSYEFTMDYLGARQSQTVLVGDGGAQVAFKTASATVTFTNSKGLPLEGGEAWAVAPNGTWIKLGTTGPTGPVSAELAPGSYEFTMDYLGARQSQTVLVGDGGISVAFQTYRAEIRGQVTDAAGVKTPVLDGTWWYVVNGDWHPIGTPDTNGDAITQLLPGTYTFVHVADDDTRHTFTDVTIAKSGRHVLSFVG